MRSPRARVAVVAALVPLTLLAACGDDKKSGEGASSSKSPAASSASASSPKAATVPPGQVTPMSAIKVSAANPKSPKVTLGKKPFRVNKTTTKVVTPGKGTPLTDKETAYVSYVAVNGSNGKTIETSFGKPSVGFDLSSQQTFPGLLKGLKGQKVGSTIAIAIPPSDGFGPQGQPRAGITGKDTLVFYMKVDNKWAVKQFAEGKAVPPKAGMPKVTVPTSPAQPAKITVPKGAKAPTATQSQVLVEGTGPVVKAGQTLKARYTGQIWSSGKIFDATAKQPGQKPADFQIGAGQVIPGWDKTLVGKKLGSRVLVVIPPKDGYGAKGNPQGGIKGTDTLVFVVDLLGAS